MLLLGLATLLLFGDPEGVVVVTRDGRTLKGLLVEEGPDTVKIHRNGITLTLSRSEISRISKTSIPITPPSIEKVPVSDPSIPNDLNSGKTPSKTIETTPSNTIESLTSFSKTPPDLAAARSFWESLKPEPGKTLDSASLDQEAQMGLARLLESHPELAPQDAWKAALQFLSPDSTLPIALLGLEKIPAQQFIATLLEVLASADEMRAVKLRRTTTAAMERMDPDVKLILKESFFLWALKEQPQSLDIARFLFDPSWKLSAEEWLRLAEAAEADVRIEALMQMATRQVRFTDLMPLDGLYIKHEDAKTRLMVLRVLDLHGKGQGARMAGFHKALLNDARTSKDNKLKLASFDRLKNETGRSYPLNNTQWDALAK